MKTNAERFALGAVKGAVHGFRFVLQTQDGRASLSTLTKTEENSTMLVLKSEGLKSEVLKYFFHQILPKCQC